MSDVRLLMYDVKEIVILDLWNDRIKSKHHLKNKEL